MITPGTQRIRRGIRVRQRIEDDRKRSRHIQLDDARRIYPGSASLIRFACARYPGDNAAVRGARYLSLKRDGSVRKPQSRSRSLVSSERRSNLRISARASRDEKLIGVGVPRYFCRLITLAKRVP